VPNQRHLNVGCALIACTTQVTAQSLPAEAQDGTFSAIVVSGTRLNLSSALGIKRERIEIVDAIAADDIAKLPDFSVTEALQRVTGVQISRDRGEGGTVSIRGLSQMETTLNGREVFTAGWGRNLDFNDIPAEMVSAIEVIKTSSAEHIEGGIGGTINLRTHRPFDFAGSHLVASARTIHGDLVNDSKQQYALLASNRWKTAAAGEFGVLLNLAVQERAWREDQKTAGAPLARTDLVPGQTVLAPNGLSEVASLGTRKREGAHLMLQWRPNEALDLYAEASHAELLTRQNSYQFNASAPGAGSFVPGSVTLFPGTSDVHSLTWTNAPFSTYGAARDTIDRTSQFALGGSWLGSKLEIKSDLSFTRSHNNLSYTAIALNGTAASLTQNQAGGDFSSAIAGTDLSNSASFSSAGLIHAARPFDGTLKSARLDAEYQLGGDFIDTLSAGLRLARRHATNAPGQVVFAPATVATGNAAGLIGINPLSDFFSGISGYLVGNPEAARDVEAVRRALGIGASIPGSNPISEWNIDEDTRSAYLMANIRSANLPLDGKFGLRVVRTQASVSGYRTSGGGVAPLALRNTYTDLLPSLNLRQQIAPGVYLRGAASKTLTRPDFNQISPSLTLNVVQRIGSAGNPDLLPVRADNFDIALERYSSKTNAIHATAFFKKVDGFVLTTSAPETYDGITYQVNRPRNANSADIKGLELGYQHLFDGLSGRLGFLRGIGLQANYTFVDSKTWDSTLRKQVPLQNLSRHSLNIVGIYERGPLSARLAWNWRDKFISGVTSVAGLGALPIYTKAYGWLDASLTWRANDNYAIAIEGLNLTRTQRRSYYGSETRPQSVWRNDRQIAATLTIRL